MAAHGRRPLWLWLGLGAVLGALLAAGGFGALQRRTLLNHLEAGHAGQQTGGGSSLLPRMPCPHSKACAGTRAGAVADLRDRRLLLDPPWPPVLTDEDVQRAAGYYGTGTRLRRVAAKLLAGLPIKAFMLGGSVTLGVGASSPEAKYAARFFDLLNTSFPHQDHVFANKGIGAAGSGIFAACLERMLPRDADLVVVEFTVNEDDNAPFDSPQRRRFEQMLRKLLLLGAAHGGTGIPSHGDWDIEGGTAIVVLHHYAWHATAGDGLAAGLFYNTSEAQLGMFANFYDLPQVSMRSAMWPLMAAGVNGFQVDKVVQPNVPRIGGGTVPSAGASERDSYFFFDQMHPADVGHKAMAEALAGPLRRALSEELAGNMRGGRPKPSWPKGVPPPMVPGNHESPTTLCAMQEDFRPMVIRHSRGFAYRAERPDKPSRLEQKWGWSGFEPGEWVDLLFDSREHPNSTDNRREVTATLVFLRSYELMGTARVACSSGCQCRNTTIDGTWSKRASLMQHHSFKVSQHRQCLVNVEIQEAPGKVPSGGHKVALMALIVTAFPLHLGSLSTSYELAASHASKEG